MITVYSKPICSQCMKTKAYFKKHSVEFEEKSVEDIPGVIGDLSMMTAPIVVMQDGPFYMVSAGYVPDSFGMMLDYLDDIDNYNY